MDSTCTLSARNPDAECTNLATCRTDLAAITLASVLWSTTDTSQPGKTNRMYRPGTRLDALHAMLFVLHEMLEQEAVHRVKEIYWKHTGCGTGGTAEGWMLEPTLQCSDPEGKRRKTTTPSWFVEGTPRMNF